MPCARVTAVSSVSPRRPSWPPWRSSSRFTLPPARASARGRRCRADVVVGAYHVHSNRSDGTGTVDEIAAAAARAGLQFVILTDHGDGTRPPDPPAYRHGVLCHRRGGDQHVRRASRRAGPAPGVSVSAGRRGAGRHRRYPSARRLGRSPRIRTRRDRGAPLARASSVPFDGVEWLNADSEWRDDTRLRLLAVCARSIVRPAESIASLFARPARSLQRWDTALRARPSSGWPPSTRTRTSDGRRTRSRDT